MPTLDLLGTIAGAAFLLGSVALATRTDRRESATPEAATEPGAAPVTSLASGGRHGLRLVHPTDR
jgi:hypothetical protein